MEEYTKILKSMLKDQQIGPELRVQDFDDYMPLINGEVIIFLVNKIFIN